MNELYHPAANIFPLMDEVAYAALRDDIAANGLIEPIWFCDGKILDGRNRWRACNELGISPEVREYTGNDPIGFVVSLNLSRRHLTSSQRAVVALEIERQLAIEAKKRQIRKPANSVLQIIEKQTDNQPIHAAKQAAALVGTNRQYVSDAKRIQAAAPELLPQIAAGELSIPEAKRVLRKKERDARRIEVNPDNGNNVRVVLYAGDYRDNINNVVDGSVNLAIIDPPYNVTNYEWDKFGSLDEFIEFTRQWLDAIRPKFAEDYHLFVFCAPDFAADIEMLLRRDGWPVKSRVIWHYRNLVRGRDVTDKFIQNWQMVFHIGTHKLNWPPDWDDSRFAVQTHAAPQSNFNDGKYHPHQKPKTIINLFVNIGSNIGDTVLDIFAGSGTTGICAVDNGRNAILMEQSPDYVEVIKNRLRGWL